MRKYTVESLAQKIKRENNKFNSATQAEQRVMIAKDCLARIEMEQIIPQVGHFCKIKDFNPKENIKTKLETTNLVCMACAKGSLFMSYIGRVNNYTANEYSISNDEDNLEHHQLLKIFEPQQLALIEYVFEGKQFIFNEEFDLSIYFKKIVKFREKVDKEIEFYTDDDDFIHSTCDIENEYSPKLLIAICKNIIKNKGTFVL